MNFEVLKYFIASERAGSFSKAADELFISQQGLNKAITSLESELGCKLMLRAKNGIVLTENGRVFLEHAKTILLNYENMRKDLSIHKKDVEVLCTQEANLTVSPVCIQTVINPMLQKSILKNTTFREVEASDAFGLMHQPDWVFLIDIFSYYHSEESLKDNYEVIPLLETKVGIISRKSFLPDLGKTISKEFASKLPLGIFDNATSRAMYKKIFSEHPLQRVLLSTTSKSALENSMLDGRFAFLADFYCWSQMPEHLKHGHDRIIFSEIEDGATITFAFVFEKSNPPSQKSIQYINSFISVFNERFCSSCSSSPYLDGMNSIN